MYFPSEFRLCGIAGGYSLVGNLLRSQVCNQMHKSIQTIPSCVMEELLTWDWPGNIRELENFMERSMIFGRGKLLDATLSELRDFGPTRKEFQPGSCRS